MATTEPKTTRAAAAGKSEAIAKPAAKRASSRGRRLRRIFFWLPVLLLIGSLAVGPSVVSYTPLGRQLAARFAPVDGSVELGSLSIGWFSPLSITDVVVRDPAGEIVAQVAAVRGDKPLWALLANRHDLGQLEIDAPNAHVVLRADGSNVEDLLAPLLKPSHGPTPAVSLAVKVADGQATIDDQTSHRSYGMQGLTLELQWQGAGDAALNLQTSGKFIDGRQETELSLLVAAEVGDADHPLGKGRMNCRCDQLPLDVLAPVLRRAMDGAQLTGRLTVALDGNWGGGADWGDSLLEGQIDVADLSFAAPILGPDRLDISKLQAPCRIVGKTGQIQIQQLLVECDLGKLEVVGSLNTPDMTASNLWASLVKQPCQITGGLNLARLVALFPHLLAMREGIQITTGELGLTLVSQAADGGGSWTGTLKTSDIEAVAEGRPLSWRQPLAVDFRVREAGAGLIVDKLDCTSSFLHVEAAGTTQQFTAALDFDLSQLAAQLGQFLDLAAYQLKGTGQGHLTCQTDAQGQLKAQGDVDVREFAVVAPGRHPWSEPRVTARAEAAGTVDHGALQQLASANLRVETQSDLLTAQLLQAVDNPTASPCPIQVDWQGNLAALLPRVEPWCDLSGWDLSGRGTLQIVAALSAAAVDVQQVKGTLEPLHFWGHGLFIDEPAVEITAAGRWQRASDKIEVSLLGLHGSSWVARLNNAELHRAESGIETTGGASLETDLATIGRWTTDPRAPVVRQVAGQLVGKIDWSSKAATEHATLSAEINNLQVALPAAPGGAPTVWQEPQVTLAVDLDYDEASDQLQLSRGQLTAAAVQAQVGGKIAGLTQTPNVDLSGQVLADLERLAPIWRPYTGPDVQIQGREPWPFELHGPWTPGAPSALAGLQQMQGQATLSWTRVSLRGIEVNRGAINAVLKDGTLTMVPVNVEVNGGKVLLSPSIHLAAQPSEIVLPRGPLVDHLEMTSEHAGRALRFITPVLAGVTRVTGQFSVSLQGGQLPLADPRTGDVAGQLVVHSVEMQPGPILQSLLGFAQQVEGLAKGQIPFANSAQPVSLIRIENQTVDFRLVGGRVYHRGLQFTAGNVTITTRGSVGLDESLSVMAEIPMHAGLLGNNSKLKGINSDSLQIPIEGTLTHPKIDPRAIEHVTAALVKNTARSLLSLPEQLEKLVPGESKQ